MAKTKAAVLVKSGTLVANRFFEVSYKGSIYRLDGSNISQAAWRDSGYSYLNEDYRIEIRAAVVELCKSIDSACPPSPLREGSLTTAIYHHRFMIPQAGSNDN